MKSFYATILFVLFGISNSWSQIDIYSCQLSWFESTQPEGIVLGAYLGLMWSVSAVIVLFLLYIENFRYFKMKTIIYISSSLAVVTCLALAFTWQYTVLDVSLFILIGMVEAVVIGWVQYIIIVPWFVKNYNSKMLSALFAGDGLMTLILVILQIIQQPGGSKTFTPTVYILIVSLVYFISLIIGVFILEKDIERVTKEDNYQVLGESGVRSYWRQFFPDGWREGTTYLFIQLWTYGWAWLVIPVVLPFAAENTTSSSTNDGENYLQWTGTVGLIGLLIGYVSSYFAKEKFWIWETLLIQTVTTAIILLAAADYGNWTSWGMRVFLMCAVALNRMLFGWIITLLFIDIDRKHPKNGEALCRFSSLWSMVFSLIIMTILWWLIYADVIF